MGFKNQNQLEKYISPIFFETGTFLGGGTKCAIQSGFTKVITVELQEYLYEQCIKGDPTGCKEDLVEEIESGIVDIHLGDTREIMWELIENIEDRITFWLDAHIDGGNYRSTTPNVAPCPLYDELDIIKKHKRKDHIILIDDLRIMGDKTKSGYGWGSGIDLESIKETILEINPQYVFRYEEGYTDNDILVAFVPPTNGLTPMDEPVKNEEKIYNSNYTTWK